MTIGAIFRQPDIFLVTLMSYALILDRASKSSALHRIAANVIPRLAMKYSPQRTHADILLHTGQIMSLLLTGVSLFLPIYCVIPPKRDILDVIDQIMTRVIQAHAVIRLILNNTNIGAFNFRPAQRVTVPTHKSKALAPTHKRAALSDCGQTKVFKR